jgi:hypothetical protein
MFNLSFDDFIRINRLDNSYWECADLVTDEQVQLLFSEDALLQVGSLKLIGRSDIQSFFQNRAQKNHSDLRITRHISSGFTLQTINANEVKAFSKVIVFSGNGEFLPLNVELPSTMADVEDLFLKNDEGVWHIAKRIISPVFVGSGAPNFAQSKGS